MNVFRRVISIALHSLAGFLVFGGEIVAFTNLPGEKAKVWIIGTLFLMAAAVFGIAVVVGNFSRRFDPVGIAMLCASAGIALGAIGVLSMLLSPDLLDMMARQGTSLHMFTQDVGEGGLLTVAVAALGWMVIRFRSK